MNRAERTGEPEALGAAACTEVCILGKVSRSAEMLDERHVMKIIDADVRWSPKRYRDRTLFARARSSVEILRHVRDVAKVGKGDSLRMKRSHRRSRAQSGTS